MPDSDWWLYISCGTVACTFLVCLVGTQAIKEYREEVTKQEAIKAGLVQDKEGHWVKPTWVVPPEKP